MGKIFEKGRGTRSDKENITCFAIEAGSFLEPDELTASLDGARDRQVVEMIQMEVS